MAARFNPSDVYSEALTCGASRFQTVQNAEPRCGEHNVRLKAETRQARTLTYRRSEYRTASEKSAFPFRAFKALQLEKERAA